jgi:hypothetical protein
MYLPVNPSSVTSVAVDVRRLFWLARPGLDHRPRIDRWVEECAGPTARLGVHVPDGPNADPLTAVAAWLLGISSR